MEEKEETFKGSFKSFYTNTAVLHWVCALAVILSLSAGIVGLIQGAGIGFFILFLFVAFCMSFLAISFFRHDKNVMKGLLGAVFTWLITFEIFYLSSLVENLKLYYLSIGNFGKVYLILEMILTFLLLVAFVSHFLINTDHHSSPKKVFFNQMVIIILMFLAVVQLSLSSAIQIELIDSSLFTVLDKDHVVMFNVFSKGIATVILRYSAIVFQLGGIICIESQLDEHRIQREEKANLVNP